MKWLYIILLLGIISSCGLGNEKDASSAGDRMFNGMPVLPYHIAEYRYDNGQKDKVLAKFIPGNLETNDKLVDNMLYFIRDSIMRAEPEVRMMGLYLYKDVGTAQQDAANGNWTAMLIQVSEKDYKVYHQ